MAKKIKPPEDLKELPHSIVEHMLRLATSGFGLVAALAWNEVIKETVDNYIKPYLGKSSGIMSLLIYAVVVTVLAVMITLQLSKVEKKLEEIKQVKKG